MWLYYLAHVSVNQQNHFCTVQTKQYISLRNCSRVGRLAWDVSMFLTLIAFLSIHIQVILLKKLNLYDSCSGHILTSTLKWTFSVILSWLLPTWELILSWSLNCWKKRKRYYKKDRKYKFPFDVKKKQNGASSAKIIYSKRAFGQKNRVRSKQ